MDDFSKYRRFYVERVQLLCWRSLFQNNFSFTVSSFFPPSFSRYCLPIIDSSHEYVCLTVRVTVTCATLVVKRSAPAPVCPCFFQPVGSSFFSMWVQKTGSPNYFPRKKGTELAFLLDFVLHPPSCPGLLLFNPRATTNPNYSRW